MTAPARFLFRVAAGPRIGFGHLMRCRALARALRVPPLVSLRGGADARRTVRALGFVLGEGVDLSTIDVVIVDDPSTRHAHAWLLRAKRAGTATAAIRDLAIAGGADLVVDGSVNARPPHGTDIALCGPRFAILDPRLLAARHGRRPRRMPRPPRVLIALGGGLLHFSIVQPLVHAIAQRCPGAVISAAGGFCLRSTPSLDGARWIERPDGLVSDLAQSDVAVVAGGVTLYEACAVGVPVVALSVVAGQRAAVEAFAARGAAIDAGAAPFDEAILADRVGASVAMLLGSWPARRRSAAAARQLVDGRGALRLASRLRSLARRSTRS